MPATARLKNIKSVRAEPVEAQEQELLNAYLTLIEQESAASKKVKDAQKQLDAKVAAQYAKLSK